MEMKSSLSTFSTCWVLCRSSTGGYCFPSLSHALFAPLLPVLHVSRQCIVSLSAAPHSLPGVRQVTVESQSLYEGASCKSRECVIRDLSISHSVSVSRAAQAILQHNHIKTQVRGAGQFCAM